MPKREFNCKLATLQNRWKNQRGNYGKVRSKSGAEEAAAHLGKRTLELIDEAELRTSSQDGLDFLGDVREKIESMLAQYEEQGFLTARQISAIENMHDGVGRWLR